MTGEEIAAALDAAGAQLPRVVKPKRARARCFTSWGEAFTEQAVQVEGGHVQWTGATVGRGTPVVSYGGQVETAYRIAFRWHFGREPVGNVRPRCDYPACVAGAHLADRRLRQGGQP